MLERAIAFAKALRGWAQRHRLPLLGFAFAFFIGGTALSLAHLDLDLAQTNPVPLALLFAGIAPLAILYSAINLQVMARASGADMPLGLALKTSVFAGLAEVLPIPGGAIVRSAALTQAGAKVTNSVELVLAFALLWIAVTATGGGFALWHTGLLAILATLASGGASLAITAWIARRYGMRTALTALALRLLGLLLTVVRVALALMALGIAFQWSDTFAFAFAIVAGTASAIVPAGLGLSEGLSALLANALAIAPAGAFLAVALSRVIGLVVNCLCAAAISLNAMAKGRMEAATDV